MTERIRIGIIGANSQAGFALQGHLPAVVASSDFELTAVCTTKMESAEESARAYGAKLAFDDYHQMLAHPEVDAVSVVVRVPSHFEPTRDAIAAGKAVYTEWPLGRTTAEAVELGALAKAKGSVTATGLQSRMNPALMYMRDLIADGYLGEVTSCHVSAIREGVLERPSSHSWQGDVTLGANALTTSAGHAIDTLVYVAGGFATLSAMVSTQIKQVLESDTKQLVDVTAPDTVTVGGRLQNGAVASVHVAMVPFAGRGYRLEIYGREGTLSIVTPGSAGRAVLQLRGARRTNTLEDLEVPERYVFVSEQTPPGVPYCIGQLYSQFAESIRSGKGDHPDFATAVSLHHLLDAIRASSESGSKVAVPSASSD
ncbi:MAG TPA: Gfo/Idh/MocA family oxidoreductase [Acidimicrobiales bacterium]|nr:Gfo/Idh/MocA family oxidoreductase [Acidimicrobiales bacterium]